jgi:hypothetical protein
MPAMGMPAPESTAVDESRTAEKAKPWSVEAIPWTNGDAEADWRNDYDRPRRWCCVIVSPRRCAVRLNHIGTAVRAWSSSKRECEHRECYE